MGQVFSNLAVLFYAPKARQISLVGLDSAGKTTILYQMKEEETLITIPTIGFNTETFIACGTTFTAWDLGGQSDIRPLWDHYIKESAGLVFVIDIMDHNRWPDAAAELNKIVKNFQNKPILILANKADDPKDPETPGRIESLKASLGLDLLDVNCYHIEAVAGKESPENPTPKTRLYSGFKWMSERLKDVK